MAKSPQANKPRALKPSINTLTSFLVTKCFRTSTICTSLPPWTRWSLTSARSERSTECKCLQAPWHCWVSDVEE
ncbi:hypothetical protein M404DRAFT_367986 [Pisolithus tinctorius Marx 270]|uniref:Uncharacterized protein n=1 Tax=Pisolithus tinctorius Marx 270 TaxID=870435 RepID=A0A0C3N1A5_PISTI|nr:hypothetical protein M404DRAFT_367986 [Pisolithus tinctorius Marx 270]